MKLNIIYTLILLALFLVADLMINARDKVIEKDYSTKMDSIIMIKDREIEVLKKEKDSLIKVKDVISVDLDSSMTRIRTLSNPRVTSADKKEALLWLEEYNK